MFIKTHGLILWLILCGDLVTLTLILLMWRIWWAPHNASKWQIGFNSAFKGLSLFMMFFISHMSFALWNNICNFSNWEEWNASYVCVIWSSVISIYFLLSQFFYVIKIDTWNTIRQKLQQACWILFFVGNEKCVHSTSLFVGLFYDLFNLLALEFYIKFK
jgi:hypothetical protein